MSTNANNLTLEDALKTIPKPLRQRLIKTYSDLKSAFIEGQFDLCGLRAGKFCEIVLRVLQNNLTGTYIHFGSKIPNFKNECEKLEQLPATSGLESLRIVIPRALNFLYTLRNKRGIGHVGGDIDANEIDAATGVRISDWCLSELIRVVHKLSFEEAQSLLDSIAERHIPLIWEVLGKKRILQSSLDYKSQVLLLLYSQPSAGVLIEDLFEWTEHSRKANFISQVIMPLHNQRPVEYDRDSDIVFISPKGNKKVEEEILPRVSK
jgi:hypothetical protein